MNSLRLCSAQHKIRIHWLIRHQLDAMRLQVQMVRGMQAASRKLCHRQLSWFRDERLFKWLEGNRPVDLIVDEIVADFSSPMNPGAPHRPPHTYHAQAADWLALLLHLCITSAPFCNTARRLLGTSTVESKCICFV